MCVACIEYMKDKLNVNEFRSALREMTQDDPEHAVAIAKIMEKYAGKPDEIKKAIKALED